MTDETKLKGDYKVGVTRMRYLMNCDWLFIQGDTDGAKESLNAFLGTVVDGTPPQLEIQTHIDKIEEIRLKNHKDLRDEIEKKGFLEQSLEYNDWHKKIDLEAYMDLKAVCWSVSLKYGLFNE